MPSQVEGPPLRKKKRRVARKEKEGVEKPKEPQIQRWAFNISIAIYFDVW